MERQLNEKSRECYTEPVHVFAFGHRGKGVTTEGPNMSNLSIGVTCIQALMIQTQELNRFGQQGIFGLLKEQIWILNKLEYTTKTWWQGLIAEIETRKGYISYLKEKVLISVLRNSYCISKNYN